MKEFDPNLKVYPQVNPLGFEYGEGCFGPKVELRKLDDIRKSLMEFDCEGPDIVYAIAMDVGKKKHRTKLVENHLLFGVVTYASGRLGKEPVRSQGHIHSRSAYGKGWSTPEVYEIWQGKAIIYMQETVKDKPGRCFAVYAGVGEVVVVPPFWGHATISADSETPLIFGAWCDREYSFDYNEVRAHNGLAWFPIYENDRLTWKANPNYHHSEIVEKCPEVYAELGLDSKISIYSMFEKNQNQFEFVPKPYLVKEVWENFIP